MENNKKKTSEEHARDHDADNLLSFIIAKTYARHSEMSEEEFLKDIGFADSGKTEDEAIRIGIFNVLVETTKQLFEAKNSLQIAHGLLKTYLIDEKITKDEEKK